MLLTTTQQSAVDKGWSAGMRGFSQRTTESVRSGVTTLRSTDDGWRLIDGG